MLPFYAGITQLSNPDSRRILLEVTTRCQHRLLVFCRMVNGPPVESSDDRRMLLALLNCIYESQIPARCHDVKAITEMTVEDNIIPAGPVIPLTFEELYLDPTDCISIGYFLANACQKGKKKEDIATAAHSTISSQCLAVNT